MFLEFCHGMYKHLQCDLLDLAFHQILPHDGKLQLSNDAQSTNSNLQTSEESQVQMAVSLSLHFWTDQKWSLQWLHQ